MVKTKWDSFSTEQLKEILLNSNTFSEVQRKIGYKYHTSRNKKIKDLANIYDIDISHYGSLENLSGRFFNNLEVIDYNNEKSKENHRPYWNCKCKCGKITVVSASSLKDGRIKSCGCLRTSNLINLENDYFKVLNQIEGRKKGSLVWRCICKSCHNKIELSTAQFNTQKSCGCKKYSNLQNKRFGKLIVIEPTEYRKNRLVVWKCKCDCGRICYVPSASLISGNTKSCSNSCGHTTIKIGDTFGKLIVLNKYIDSSTEGMWECQCTCGNKIVAKGMLLKNGTKKSCGCLNSSGNYQIQQLLKSLNLSYKSEYSFDDLKDKNKLRFDFAVFKNNKLKFLIEYNGKQHYEPVPFFGGEKTFLEQCYKDFLKKEYCKQNHIPLIVFKYNEEVNVSNLLSKIEEVEDNV